MYIMDNLLGSREVKKILRPLIIDSTPPPTHELHAVDGCLILININ